MMLAAKKKSLTISYLFLFFSIKTYVCLHYIHIAKENMKYYCIDEECGFYKYLKDTDIRAGKEEHIRICERCSGIVLAYEDHTYPTWIRHNVSTR
jgi:hypothetical protein